MRSDRNVNEERKKFLKLHIELPIKNDALRHSSFSLRWRCQKDMLMEDMFVHMVWVVSDPHTSDAIFLPRIRLNVAHLKFLPASIHYFWGFPSTLINKT